MNRLITALAIWGLADSVFMAARPRTWSNFWSRGVQWIGKGKQTPRVLACVQVALCLWMLSKSRD